MQWCIDQGPQRFTSSGFMDLTSKVGKCSVSTSLALHDYYTALHSSRIPGPGPRFLSSLYTVYGALHPACASTLCAPGPLYVYTYLAIYLLHSHSLHPWTFLVRLPQAVSFHVGARVFLSLCTMHILLLLHASTYASTLLTTTSSSPGTYLFSPVKFQPWHKHRLFSTAQCLASHCTP